MSTNQVSWSKFESINSNVRNSFEDMCRMLFKRQFFNINTIFNSLPNHPGIEIFPILEISTNKRISFQAKYFENKVDFTQIEKSVNKTIKYYTNELDVLYLYCNKDINTDSKVYKRILNNLENTSIEIRLVTNNTILDLVREYSSILSLFFNEVNLSSKWFEEKLDISLNSLGARYNKLFNVSTDTEKKLNLFLSNSEVVKLTKQKRSNMINELFELSKKLENEEKVIMNMINWVNLLTIDETVEIHSFFEFERRFENDFNDELVSIRNKIEELEEEKSRNEFKQFDQLINLYSLNSISKKLEYSILEKDLIKNKILFLEGEAGIGKTQLLANKAKALLDMGNKVLLLSGFSFISDVSLQQQAMSLLMLNIDFDEFLNILEGIGELKNKEQYIFIDAINETENKKIWKVGLSSFINEINKFNFIKVVISYRTGYEKLLLSEDLYDSKENNIFSRIIHKGFQNNTLEAIKEFLNYFKIPFSPTNFIQYKMSNPLFLTMFCKVYNGKNFEFRTLMEKFIDNADYEVQSSIGLDGSMRTLSYLIREIAAFQLKKNSYTIDVNDIYTLDFWETYGLSQNKISYVSALKRSGILIGFIDEDKEKFRFGYNLLEDYIYAKTIMDYFPDKNKTKEYLIQLLQIKNGEINNYKYVDVFIIATTLYKKKFGEECIDIIDSITDEYNKNIIFESYIEAFSWRTPDSIDSEYFIKFINVKQIESNIVFRVMIENSVKKNHDLNAYCLHSLLIKMDLNQRDYLWTRYINSLSEDDERLYQLINYFEKGNNLDNLDNERVLLLLILLTWILSSSNRVLRDKASKAMIEILKQNFSLCLSLLIMFENVNDPYIYQRLFGVVFGSVVKRKKAEKNEYLKLVNYIYLTIFDRDSVYPDILLRDYAKLIIEKFFHEYPNESTAINISKIFPPYNSTKLPIIINSKENFSGGMALIESSMAIERSKMVYGDFGRYVFESALDDFADVDIENAYKYSMKFIEKYLGYDNDLFSEYDRSIPYTYNRHETKKIERIGKKYQWIAMYNVLARISDHHKLKKDWDDITSEYDGGWNPYVRDFDPTLNNNFLVNPDIPKFKKNNNEHIFISDESSVESINDWVNNDDDQFFKTHQNNILTDSDDVEWVCLSQHKKAESVTSDSTKSKSKFGHGFQDIWAISNGYFVKNEEYEDLKKEIATKSFIGRWFPESHQTVYTLFNREYGWSKGYKETFESAWLDFEVESDEFIIETIEYPDLSALYSKDYNLDNGMPLKVEEIKVPQEKVLAKVMQATNGFLWEEQYDASQDEATSFEVPCNLIMEKMNLTQRKYDGSYYNNNNELICFNRIIEHEEYQKSLVIKKEYLEQFLNENKLKLFWCCLGEKRFILGEMKNQIWSEWSGFLHFCNNKVKGDIRHIKNCRSEN